MLGMTQFCGFMAKTGIAPLTVAFQASALSTGTTITGPASIIAGDLLVLQDCVVNDALGAPADVVPSGFTRVSTQADASFRFTLSYKIATGAEASASLTGMSTDLETLKTLLVFRPLRPLSGVTLGSVVVSYVSTNPAAQVITAGSGVAPLVVIGSYQVSGVEVSPRTFSTTPDGEVQRSGVQMEQWIAYKSYNTSPADTTIDFDDEGSRNCLIGCYFALAG